MILKRLVLSNFRQFCGQQEINFANSAAGGQNVTVVYGENGRGKTGIFRAIMFCLFGDRRLSQDGTTSEHEIQMVNTYAIHDIGSDNPVNAFVELQFSHKGIEYSLRREMMGMQSDGRIYEEFLPARLTITDVVGNSKIINDPVDIDACVNAILDRRVKEYFLFDGEKIERLTKASLEQRKEIQTGIRNLLNVDALENAIAATKRLVKSFESELDDDADVVLLRIANKLHDNEEERDRSKERLAQIESEAEKATSEKQLLDAELERFGEIKHLVDRRGELSESLAKRQSDADYSLIDMKQVLGKAVGLLAKDPLRRVFEHIDQRKERGEIPPQIRVEVIDKILADGRCICGREVCEGFDCYDTILAWRDKTVSPKLQQSALDLWSDLKTLLADQDQTAQSSTAKVYRYANVKNDIQEIRQKLAEVSDQIGTSERLDAQKLERQRSYVEDQLVRMQAERQRLKEDLENLAQEYERLKAQRREKEAELARNNEISRRWSLARDTQEALERVYQEFTQDIKVRISKTASRVFQGLIDAEERKNLATIIVNDDYSLQMLDRWDKPYRGRGAMCVP